MKTWEQCPHCHLAFGHLVALFAHLRKDHKV